MMNVSRLLVLIILLGLRSISMLGRVALSIRGRPESVMALVTGLKVMTLQILLLLFARILNLVQV